MAERGHHCVHSWQSPVCLNISCQTKRQPFSTRFAACFCISHFYCDEITRQQRCRETVLSDGASNKKQILLKIVRFSLHLAAQRKQLGVKVGQARFAICEVRLMSHKGYFYKLCRVMITQVNSVTLHCVKCRTARFLKRIFKAWTKTDWRFLGETLERRGQYKTCRLSSPYHGYLPQTWPRLAKPSTQTGPLLFQPLPVLSTSEEICVFDRARICVVLHTAYSLRSLSSSSQQE